MTDQNARQNPVLQRGAATRKADGALFLSGIGPIAPRFAIALSIFIVVFAACSFYLRPEIIDIKRKIIENRDAMLALQLQTDALRSKFAENQKLRAEYDALEKAGFLAEQKRLPAIRILETLRNKHRITGLEYQILPAAILQLGSEEVAGAELVTSNIILSLRGFMDKDLVEFADAVRRELPGHVVVESFEMSKLAQPNAASLARIRAGAGADMVSGKVTMSWRVMRQNEKAATQ